MQTYMEPWTAIFQTRLIWPKSYYKNILALKLFVGCVFAYLQIHMFSLTKIPRYIRSLLTPHISAKGRPQSFIFTLLARLLITPSVCLHATTWEENPHSFADRVKRATRVLNVLWPCKYLPVIHC